MAAGAASRASAVTRICSNSPSKAGISSGLDVSARCKADWSSLLMSAFASRAFASALEQSRFLGLRRHHGHAGYISSRYPAARSELSDLFAGGLWREFLANRSQSRLLMQKVNRSRVLLQPFFTYWRRATAADFRENFLRLRVGEQKLNLAGLVNRRVVSDEVFLAPHEIHLWAGPQKTDSAGGLCRVPRGRAAERISKSCLPFPKLRADSPRADRQARIPKC